MEERLNNDGFGTNTAGVQSVDLEQIQSYKKQEELPEHPKNQIFIDKKRDSLLLPINGEMMIAHVMTIKNVSKIEEGNKISLRLNFFYVTATTGYIDNSAAWLLEPRNHQVF